jgi:hypothetical protein
VNFTSQSFYEPCIQGRTKGTEVPFPCYDTNSAEKGNMPAAPFDILRRHQDGSFIWLEAASDIQTAKARLQQLFAVMPGEYFVFDQSSQQIVAKLVKPPRNAD